MSHPRALLAGALIAAVSSLGAPGPADAEPHGQDVACGAVVTTSTVLRADLEGCPDNGLVIAADHITVDLNGHTIEGDGALVEQCPDDTPCDVGIVNDAGHVGVTVKGGSVTGFGLGLLLVGADETRLRHLLVSDSTFPGVLAVASAGLEVTDSVFADNGVTTDSAGLAAIEVTDSLIAGNRMVRNGDAGLFTRSSSGNRIIANTVRDNLHVGILVDGDRNTARGNAVRRNGDGIIVTGDDNVVKANVVADSVGCGQECGIGISLEGGDRNLVARNTVVRAARLGIRVDAFVAASTANVVRRNIVRAVGGDGVAVDVEAAGPVAATVVQGNRVSRAGDDGIDIDSPETVVTGNLVRHNHDLGIEAVPGVTDGGANRAAANGNPLQCTEVRCG